MQVSATAWNKFVDQIFRSRLVSVFLGRSSKWQHPWYSSVSWNPEFESYSVRVKPGFCVSGSTVEVTARGQDGEDVRLSDDPDIPISAKTWRAIGTDALSGEVVPEFFKSRGVLDPEKRNPVTGAVIISGFDVDRSDARLLRACDVILHHDRLQTSIDWSFGSGYDGNFAQMNVILTSSPNQRRGAYLRVGTKYKPLAEVDPLLKLLGGYRNDSFDSIRIATLYLLSPPGYPKGSEPDEGVWQGYVRHHTYWNLSYWQKIVEPPPSPENLRLAGGTLGGGTLGAVGNPLLSVVNDNNAKLTALVSGAEASGAFFSA